MSFAIECKDTDIIKFVLYKRINNYYKITRDAAYEGRFNIIKTLISFLVILIIMNY